MGESALPGHFKLDFALGALLTGIRAPSIVRKDNTAAGAEDMEGAPEQAAAVRGVERRKLLLS
jgi:hypothetical protein